MATTVRIACPLCSFHRDMTSGKGRKKFIREVYDHIHGIGKFDGGHTFRSAWQEPEFRSRGYIFSTQRDPKALVRGDDRYLDALRRNKILEPFMAELTPLVSDVGEILSDLWMYNITIGDGDGQSH